MASEADNIAGLYQRHGTAWAKLRGNRRNEGDWLERFAALMPAGGSLLDIGCGAGEPIARWFIEAGHPVTGVDVAPDLIALCESRFPEQSWSVGDMRKLALGRAFDGLIAWDSFFHLDHDAQRGMFPIFRDHAAPGAALMFTSGPAHGVAIGEFAGEPLYHASLDPAEYRALMEANGFEVVDYRAEDPAAGKRTVWLARRR